MSTNVFNNLLLVFFGSIHVAGCKTPATKRNSSPAGIQKSCLDRCRTCPLQLKENSSPAGIQKVVVIGVGHIGIVSAGTELLLGTSPKLTPKPLSEISSARSAGRSVNVEEEGC